MGWISRVLAAATCALLVGCAHPPPIQAPAGVELTPIRTIAILEEKVLLALTGVKGVPVANAVDCYRMRYFAPVGPNGEVEPLSGLLALPHGVAARRLVSFQHGTTTTRGAVPSQPDGTGIAAAIVFAGNGYALVAPDYPGASPGRHPYYVTAAVGPSIVAMIDAARKLKGVPDAPVFLSGFSEGGWASLAALRILEGEGRPVLGSAQVAGAYDLRNVSVPAAMKGGAPSHSLYLAYAAWGQSAYYGRPLDSVLTPQKAALVEHLFAGAAPDEIVKDLPSDPRQLFNQSFLDAYDHGGSNWFLDAFTTNSLTDVTPRAPVRLYFGSRDVDVPHEEAFALAKGLRARGAEVSVVDVGPFEHNPSMLAAAPSILAWLRQLEAGAKR